MTRRVLLGGGVACLLVAPIVAMLQRGPGGAAQGGDGFVRAAARAIAHGQYDRAESLARARPGSDPAAAAVLARAAVARGQYDDATSAVERVAQTHPTSDAALELGLLLLQRGRKADARRVLTPIVDGVRATGDAERLFRAARAAHALGQSRTANDLFRSAARAAPDDPAINAAWGELFLEKHNRAEAAVSFRAVLERDPEWAPAHLGLARALADEDPAAASAAAGRALTIDGALLGAHLFRAQAALDADRPADARAALARALAVNPRSPEAHALRAAIAYIDGPASEYEAELARALGVNPTFGEAYRIVAEQAANRKRFDEAVALTRRAVALDPDNVGAQADLGLHLLRVGEEREARQVLDAVFREDPFDLVTFNMLQLLDTLDTYEAIPVAGGAAIVRLHPSEAPLLRHYAVPIVEQALVKLGARYGIRPARSILVEIFEKHDDFAVRTAGLPGLLNALGATFGRVVTLDSPHARPPGAFNWQSTLWHELAHVFTLQLSNQRAPLWLTEGISVWEEGQVRREWAQDFEVAFARVHADGEVPKLADLNAAFSDPHKVSLAYYQSSLVIEVIVERYGEAGLRSVLIAYGGGLGMEAALREALGVGVAELQATFDTTVEQRFGGLGRALQMPKGVEIPRGADASTIQALAARYPGSYPLHMAAGQALAAAGARDAALAAYERAAALVPTATGQDSPRARIAVLAEQQGDRPRALAELRALVSHDHDNVEAARKLAALAEQAGDGDARLLAYDRVVTTYPGEPGAHRALGQIAFKRSDFAVALREFQAAIASGPVDAVSARCDLAEAFLAAGRRDDARREALAALKIAPTYERAQDLLLKAMEGR
jgi:tetratricopeptide (TPR) repeat protein